MSMSSARASATPTPHSAAMDMEEAEEGEQETNITGPISCGNDSRETAEQKSWAWPLN